MESMRSGPLPRIVTIGDSVQLGFRVKGQGGPSKTG